MNTTSTGKLGLSGGTADRTNQLAFLSLADGQSNTYIGLNAGNKFPSYPGLNCFVGAGSGGNTRFAMTSVYLGALSGQNSERIGDTVAIGYGSAQSARECYSSVLVGSGSGAKLVRSELNTALGHQSFSGVVSASRCVAAGAYSSRFSQGITDNCYLGYACGQSSRGSDSVYVGSMCAQVVNGNAVTSIGAGSLANTVYASNAVVCGTFGGENAQDVRDVVMAGYGVGRGMRNVSSSLVLGTGAGQSMTNSSFCVVAGHLTGQVMVNSSFNTLIGGLSAANVEARYTTMVGSGSMNRRNNERVKFSNCVIVGESITFDLPLQNITLSTEDAVNRVSTGNTFYDPKHLFPSPFLELVGTIGGNGSIEWTMEEGLNVTTLDVDQRDMKLFASLQVGVGTWSLQWFVQAGETPGTFTSKYACNLSITSDGLAYALGMSIQIEGDVVATKTIRTAIVPGVTTWMDLTIHQKPSPQGIYFDWKFVTNGVSSSSTESALDASVLVEDYGYGFAMLAYATRHPSVSSVTIRASSPGSLAPKSVYAVLEYKARRDEFFTSGLIFASDPHTIEGSGPEASVNTTDAVGGFELVLVDPPLYTGFTAARYASPTSIASIDLGAHFKIPISASFGLEWFSNISTTETSLGDGYVMECIVNGNSMSIVVYYSGSVLLRCVHDQIFGAYAATVGGRNATLPFDIAAARSHDEAFIGVEISHTIGAKITMTIRVLGYAAGSYAARLPPMSSQQYTFTILDETVFGRIGSGDSEYGFISVYGSSSDGQITARDFSVRSTQYRSVPEFERCVFVGSNFTVEQNLANTFVLSLGSEYQLINGTPETFEINSGMMHLNGAVIVGASPVNNYIGFRGLADDGYEVNIPTTYIGERVYDAGTERTELLLFKGEDGVGALGPDRVRVLSGEFHVQTFTNSVADVYTYSRAGFMDAGNADALTVMVANKNGLGILKAPDAGYELDINGSKARKLTGTTWLEGSDERIKSNIEDADTDECCRILKKIPLKRFTYDPTYTGFDDDARVYGWLGQDVERVVERAVTQTAAHGFEDFRTLDSDQLLKIMWGALQNVIRKVDTLTE
jgi:hypothetical protein